MTAREIFDWMESMNPSPYTEEQKTLWLNDLESALWTEVFLQPAGLWKPRTAEEGDMPLLLPESRRMLYAMYLWAMMDFARGEYGAYANAMEMYNRQLAQLQCWYAENYAPAMTQAVWTEWAHCTYDGTGEPRCIMSLPGGCAVLGAECRVEEAGDLQSITLGAEAEPGDYMPLGTVDLTKKGPSRFLRFSEPCDRVVYAGGEGTGTVKFRLLLQPDARSCGGVCPVTISVLPCREETGSGTGSGGNSSDNTGDSGSTEGGSGGTETTTHGVIWDLVNVTSSNAIASVSDGASLVAVLTAADGYTLGDVTVTMGGEALTEVWNADTATVTIASVTGDVMVSCAGVVITEEKLDVTFVAGGVPDDGSFSANDGTATRCSHVDLIDASQRSVKFVFPYSAEYCNDETSQFQYGVARYNLSGEFIEFVAKVWSYIDVGGSCTFESGYKYRIFIGRSNHNGNGNMVNWANNTLEIYLTGATALAETALSLDDDYAMDYGIATAALVTDGSASTNVDIDETYAAVIEEAKNAWLSEANGDIDKIPLLIHTDQHSNFNQPLWDFISEIVDWYDVGKVINLGDTVNSYGGDLLSDSGLESYVESMAGVPYSKRIEVFGNHDTWGSDDTGTIGLTPQNYLHKYFRNIYARRMDNYGNFVVRDDNYNVKYVVVSGFAYDSDLGGYSHYVIPSASIDRIISELEKADGYDVIILSHVPLSGVNFKSLDDLWSGRKAKTSGSVIDEYGVTHEFDFTSCDGELLCGLHGHEHDDGHSYIGELLDTWFDAYYISPKAFYFVLIDRANRQLNVWKVDDTPQYQNYQIPLDKPETE